MKDGHTLGGKAGRKVGARSGEKKGRPARVTATRDVEVATREKMPRRRVTDDRGRYGEIRREVNGGRKVGRVRTRYEEEGIA